MEITDLERAKWMNDFLAELSVGSSFIEMSYYNPKQFFSETGKMYYRFLQPIIISALGIWFIVLIRALKTDEYMKKYGFTTLHSCTDLLVLLIPNIFVNYILSLKVNYVKFEMCYAFEFAVLILPRVLYLFSQWVKVFLILQRYLLYCKPMYYTTVYNTRKVIIYLCTLTVFCCSVGVIHVFFIHFEKVVTIDRASKETLEICRKSNFFLEEREDEYSFYQHVSDIAETIVSFVIPLICYIAFCIAAILKLRSQMAFRRQFRSAITAYQTAEERLIKITIASTVYYAVSTTLCLCILILLMVSSNDVLEYATIIDYTGAIFGTKETIHIPVNFLIYSWLSESFRNKVSKALSKSKIAFTRR